MDWKTLPGYDEKYSRHTVKERKSFGGKEITVYYGAMDEQGKPVMPSNEPGDGHGEWYGIETLDGEFMLKNTLPASQGGTVTYGTEFKDDALAQIENDLAKKKELCDTVRDLINNREATKEQLDKINEAFQNVHDWHTAKDAEYDDYMARQLSAFEESFKKQQQNATLKAEIVKKAEELKDSTAWREAQGKFNDLMSAWKEIGDAGSEDDTLYAGFKAARDHFHAARKEYFNSLDEMRAEMKTKKEDIIARAKEFMSNDNINYKNGIAVMNGLMDEWKELKSAGREFDDDLWNQFKTLRNEFFSQKKAYFAKVDAERKAVIEKKQALIQEAKEISAKNEYGKELTERMKQLDVEWRAAGYAGKDLSDKLWDEFKNAKEVFWNAKHNASQERFKVLIDKKNEQIATLKAEINQLEEDYYQTDDVQEQREMMYKVDDKKSFIEDLKKDIEDLQAKISE